MKHIGCYTYSLHQMPWNALLCGRDLGTFFVCKTSQTRKIFADYHKCSQFTLKCGFWKLGTATAPQPHLLPILRGHFFKTIRRMPADFVGFPTKQGVNSTIPIPQAVSVKKKKMQGPQIMQQKKTKKQLHYRGTGNVLRKGPKTVSANFCCRDHCQTPVCSPTAPFSLYVSFLYSTLQLKITDCNNLPNSIEAQIDYTTLIA